MGTDWNLDLAVLPNELKLLLLFVKSASEGSKTPYVEDLFVDTDWNLFLELARHHRVYPYIFKQVKSMDGLVPSYVIQELRHEYQRNTFYMLRLSGEMEQFCKLLSDNEIQVLLLKGPALAADLYSDLSSELAVIWMCLFPLMIWRKHTNYW